jgi:hypothetical protein
MGEATRDKGTIPVSAPKLVFGKVLPDRRRLKKANRNGHALQEALFTNGTVKRARRAPALPPEDNTPEGLQALLAANRHYRDVAWPEPFNRTTHRLHLGDARNLSWIPDASVQLVVTSPPYWTLKEYAPDNRDQMGHFEDYERFLSELDRVWRECKRVLVGGGRICCVVGDVCIPRKRGEGITSFPFIPIFRYAPAELGSIACSRFFGTRSPMARPKRRVTAQGSTESPTSPAASSRTTSSTFCSFGRAVNTAPFPPSKKRSPCSHAKR